MLATIAPYVQVGNGRNMVALFRPDEGKGG